MFAARICFTFFLVCALLSAILLDITSYMKCIEEESKGVSFYRESAVAASRCWTI